MGQIGNGNLGSAFPGALDSLLYSSSGKSAYLNSNTTLPDTSQRMDAEVLNDVIDAIIAIQTNIGVNAQDIYASIDARLDAIVAGSYSAEVAQDDVGGILVDTATINLTYNDATPSITADVIANSIGATQIAQFAANTFVGNPTGSLANVTAITLATGLRFTGGALDYNINALTNDATPDGATDYVVTWDASASAHKKVLLNNIAGAYGTENAQDDVGGILTDSATIDFTYNDGAPSITAIVVANSIGASQIAQFAANTLVGNPTGSLANVTAITLATGLRFATGALDHDINALTADGTPDAANDYVMTWDASASAHKKVLLNLIGGSLSGGAANKLAIWSGASTLTNDTDLHYDSTTNNLGIGTATFGTGLRQGIALTYDDTNVPTTNITNAFQMYAADLAAANTIAFIKGENGGFTGIGDRVVVNSAVALGIAAGGILLEGIGPNLRMSSATTVAHGITTLVPTSVFWDIRPVSNDGGVQMRSFTESDVATIISSIGTSNPATTKSTTADGALRFEFGKKNGTTAEAMGAGVNLVVFTDVFAGGLGTRWILDNDGDTWQTGSLTLDGSIVTGGNTARSLTVNRHTTANTAGNNFTIESGGATVAATDKVGGNIIVKTGIGTGNAVPSGLQVQAPAFKGASGTTSQTLVNRLLLNGTASLTTGVASTLITIPLATLEQAGGILRYTIDASDGTDMLNLSGEVAFSAVNKAGTYTTNASVLGTESLAKSDAGDTLTTSFGFNNGSNQTQLQITPTITGITPTTFRIVYEVFTGAQQHVVLN